METIENLTEIQMIIGMVPILFAIGISAFYKLGLTKTLCIGVIRATVQLSIMGLLLTYIFSDDNPFFICALLVFMVCVATEAGLGRVAKGSTPQEKKIKRWILLLSISVSSAIVVCWLQFVIVRPEPLWKGMYVIPMASMIIGQAMNSSSLAMERYRSELQSRAGEIQLLLALGADQKQASHGVTKKAIAASLLPTINTMMVLGIVTLPGMMSGQILSGVDPNLAVRYQLLIYFSIVSANAVASYLAVSISRKQYFTKSDQFLVPRDGSE